MDTKIMDLFEVYPLQVNYVLVFLFFFIPFLFITGFYILLKTLKRFPLPIKKEKKKEIKINLKNPKETAYTITFLIYKTKTPYNTELLKRLEEYKYKKQVNQLDRETVELIKKFLEYIKTRRVSDGNTD
jgi:hypothetical protein